MAIEVRIRGASMAPGQREGGRWRRGGVVAAAAAVVVVVVVIATVAVARQHQVLKMLRDVVEGALLHLEVARAVRDREQGGAQMEGSRATVAGVSWWNGGRRVHIAT